MNRRTLRFFLLLAVAADRFARFQGVPRDLTLSAFELFVMRLYFAAFEMIAAAVAVWLAHLLFPSVHPKSFALGASLGFFLSRSRGRSS